MTQSLKTIKVTHNASKEANKTIGQQVDSKINDLNSMASMATTYLLPPKDT